MLKNKFKIITLLLVVSMIFIVPIVRAENETTDTNVVINEDPEANNNQQVTNISETNEESQNIQNPEDSFKKSDVYLVGDNITIDYIVDGNLFVCANSVTINSQIGGDAFIIANSVTIGENGYIFSNLFTTSESVDVKGVVYDIYALSNNINISGYVYRDIKVGCNTLNILGTIGRNAFVDCNNITFAQSNIENPEQEPTVTSNGSISGDLNYSSKNEISIPENAVTGNVNYTKSVTTSENNIQDKLYSLGSLIATTIILWLLCLWLAPKFIEKSSDLAIKKPLPVIGLGILAPIVIAIASIILLILGITSVAGLILLAQLFIVIAISTALFIITANNIICNKLKIEKKLGIFGMLIVSSIVLWLVKLIPYLGTLVSLVASIIGLGIITSNFILKVNDKKEDTKQEKNAE